MKREINKAIAIPIMNNSSNKKTNVDGRFF
jgi:hypothetical protein